METQLKNALKGNALFSACSGLMALLFATPVSTWMGMDYPLMLSLLGISLLGFAGSIFWVLRQAPLPQPIIWGIIILDGLWVVGSLLIGLLRPFGLTHQGLGLIGGIAAIVLCFGILQWKFLNQLK